MQQGGGIVVANSGEQQLCYYDARGAFVKKAGRKGAGPGEFAAMADASLYRGDSILVNDPMQRRVSILGPAGEAGRQFTVLRPDTLGSQSLIRALLNGDLILGFNEVKTMAAQKDAVVFHQQIFRATPAGVVGSRVTRLVEGEHFVQSIVTALGGRTNAYWSLQWGRSTSLSALPAGLVGGDGGDNVITEYNATGQPVVLHVAPLTKKPVTADVIARFKQATLSAAKPEDREQAQRMVDEMPYPKEMPAYNAVIADLTGPIWVQSYPDSTGSYWLRLDPATITTRGYRFPAKFRLYAVRADRACGVGRDDDDLQTVYCFTIPR